MFKVNNSKFSKLGSLTIVYAWLLLLFPALLRPRSVDFPTLFYVFAPFTTLSVALSETFLYFALFESFPLSVSFAVMSILNCFEKVPKNPLQAMSSAPEEEAGRHVRVVNLTKREIEEVTNEVPMLENKGRKRRTTSSGQPRKEQK